jgi:tetratricopeptide (TPR) repeat protein
VRATERLVALALVAIAAGTFVGSLGHGFVLDDGRAVLRNRCVVAAPTPACAFSSDFWGRPAREVGRSYRPLVALSFALDWRLGGGRPLLFHLGNVLLHAAVSLLLFLVLKRLGAELAPALGGAALFAALAAHTDAVSAIVGRADLLAALLGLSAVLLALPREPVRPPSPLRLALAATACGGALLSHELAILVPVLLWAGQGVLGIRGRVRLLGLAPVALTTLLYLGLRLALLGRIVGPPPDALNNPAVEADLPGRLLLGLDLVARGLGTLLLPLRLSAEYGRAEIAVPAGAEVGVLLGGLALVGLASLAWLGRRRAPLAAAGALFLLAGLLLLSNTVVLMPTAFAERLLYLPSLGLAFVVAAALSAVRGRPRLLLRALCALAVLGNAAVAFDHGRAYRDSVALFASATRARPTSARAQLNLGLALNERGRHVEAVGPLERALAIVPELDVARRELAMALDMTGKPERAAPLFAAVHAAHPRDPFTVQNYAVFLLRRGQPARAEAILVAYLRSRPGDRAAARLLERARARRAPP